MFTGFNASSTIMAEQVFDVWHFSIPKDYGLLTVLAVGRPTIPYHQASLNSLPQHYQKL
jgi:hypothetical protein